MEHLHLWRAFLAVHASGSISAAARSLGLSQPTVSAQLHSLEAAVGEELFVREARGVTPSPRADDLARRLSGPFEQLGIALAGATGGSAAAPHPPVRIGGAAELLAQVVAPALAPLLADGVRVHVSRGLTAGLLEATRAGMLDIAIVSERPRGRTVAVAPFVDETFVMVANPDVAGIAHDGSGGGTRDPSRFRDVPLLAYAQDLPVLRRFWRHVFERRLDREPALVFPDLRALREAAIAGAGITVLPSYLCRDALDEGRLIDVCPTDDRPINTLFLVSRHGSLAGRPDVARVRDALRIAVRPVVADDQS